MSLVEQSKGLPKTETLAELQRYVKSCLYYRLGDFILASLPEELTNKSQLVLALCAYALAVDHLCRDVASYASLTPAEALNMLELFVLLTVNSSIVGGLDAVKATLREDDVSCRCRCR